MNFSKKILIILSAAVILLALLGTASAVQLNDASWNDGGTFDDQVLDFKESKVLKYELRSESMEDIQFVLKIKNVDPDPSVMSTDVGYSISASIGGGGDVTDTKSQIVGDNLVYTFTIEAPPGDFTLSVTVGALVNKVYPNETITINAEATQMVSGNPTSANSEEAKVRVNYPTTGVNTRVQGVRFLNPSILPAHGSEVDLYLTYHVLDYTNHGRVGFTFEADSYTFDFSNILIRGNESGGYITLSEWQALSGMNHNILELMPPSDEVATLFETNVVGNTITFTPKAPATSIVWVGNTIQFPFKIKLSDEFKQTEGSPAMPSINFNGVAVSGENVQFNGRGPSATIKTGVGYPLVEANKLTVGLSNVLPEYVALESDENVSVTFMPPTQQTTVLAYSRPLVYSVSGPFEYQNLFKVQMYSTELNGSDYVIDFTIPDGVTVTHLRLPNKNIYSQYDSISIWDGTKFTPLTSGTNNDLTAYSFGNKVTLQFKKVIRMLPHDISPYSEDFTSMMTFIGQIDKTAPPSLSFDAVKNGTADSISAVAQSVAVYDKYTNGVGMDDGNIFTSSLTAYGANPSGLKPGDTFYMFARPVALGVSHSAVRYLNPASSTGVYSNPIVYFSVPPGLIPGDPIITTSANKPDPVELNNKTGTNQKLVYTHKVFDDDGLYGTGGKLVAVKIDTEIPCQNDESFWVNSLIVRLPVTVSEDYNKKDIPYNQKDVVVSSWATDSHTTTSMGTRGAITELKDVIAHSADAKSWIYNEHGTYSVRTSGTSVTFAPDESVAGAASINMSGNFMSYRDGSDASYPKLHAGSQNEEFRVSLVNNANSKVETAKVYFVLPNNGLGWAPELTTPKSGYLSLVGNLPSANVKIYYSEDAGSNPAYEFGDLASWTWEEITPLNVNTLSWSDINAIRLDLNDLDKGMGAHLLLPFVLPDAKVSDFTTDAERFALGQTLFHIQSQGGTPLTIDKGATAAIEIVSTKSPEIVYIDPIDPSKIIPFGGSKDIELNVEDVPANIYGSFIVRDDYGASGSPIGLSSILIEKEKDGGLFETVYTYDISSLSSAVSSSPYTETGYGGYVYTFKNDPVGNYLKEMNKSAGRYRITLTSEKDGDLNSATESFLLKVIKIPENIQIKVNPVIFEMNSDNKIFSTLPDGSTTPGSYTWSQYVTHFVDIDDYGVTSHDVNKFSPQIQFAGISKPGNTTPQFLYRSPGLDSGIAIDVPVTVILYDNLTVKATVDDAPLTTLTVAVDDNVLPPSGPELIGAEYVTQIKGTLTDPTKVAFTVSYTGIPKSLANTDAANTPVNGALDVSRLYEYPDNYSNLEVLKLKSAAITAKTTQNIDGVVSVELFKVGSPDTSLGKLETPTTADSFVFTKKSGDLYFEDEQYYVKVILKPGYKLSGIGLNCEVLPNGLLWKSAAESFAHDDLVFDLAVDDYAKSNAPVITDLTGTAFTNTDVEFTDTVSSDLYGFIITDDNGKDGLGTPVNISEIKVGWKELGSTDSFADKLSYSGTGVDAVVTFADNSDNTIYSVTYGFKGNLKDYFDKINETPGTHQITLKSEKDVDGSDIEVSYEIKVEKDETKVDITSSPAEYYMGDSLPSGFANWEEYIRATYIDVVDYGDEADYNLIKPRLTPKGTSFAGVDEPVDHVEFEYEYRTPGLVDPIPVKVEVTVIFKDDLVIKAEAAGKSLEMLTVSVTNGLLTPTVNQPDPTKGEYVVELIGTSTNPTKAEYEISYSNVPKGLDAEGTYDSLTDTFTVAGLDVSYTTAGDYSYSLTLTPVDIKAAATGETAGIVSVELYHKTSGDLIGEVNADAFDKPAGKGWFDDGDYIVVVQLKPGYELDTAAYSQLDSDNSLIWTSSDQTLDYADLTFDFEAVKAPFVTGFVWNDLNKDSMIDIGEDVLPDVEIELYDNSGNLIDAVKTQEDGYYCFYGMPEGEYYIQAKSPRGYLLSAFIPGGDQTVNKSNASRSDSFPLDVTNIWQEDMNVGLYRETGGGSGFGQAFVVTSTSGGTVLVQDPETGDVREPGFTEPIPTEPEKSAETEIPWVFIGLSVLGILLFGILWSRIRK
ncbi:hypothetical protein MmiAt1_15420 [Methanimicrococcus sp. At1]|uniref:SD-repeat containing protein B domain-containing protein n=1 Tax=Methanimicrococcus hacksteinii TaxID=3028293 RepID=A0ABU3VR97_9EURY|nr:SdrD B-like domain-containing protein [Methanimicrococcus sp. At1]MDV0445938.1 hypothetical protein [Methanimicrococcus sp. At1]